MSIGKGRIARKEVDQCLDHIALMMLPVLNTFSHVAIFAQVFFAKRVAFLRLRKSFAMVWNAMRFSSAATVDAQSLPFGLESSQ